MDDIAEVLGDLRRFHPKIVDVGASEGEYISTSFDLIRSHGWSGILIEPIPMQFEQLCNLYKGFDNVECIRAALCDHDGTVTLYGHANDGDGARTANHGASLLPLSDSPVSYQVPAISYASFLLLHHLDDVGVLAIDTEGYDINIIDGLFSATVERPQAVVTEFSGVDTEPIKRQLLINYGYRLLHDNHHDTVWVLR